MAKNGWVCVSIGYRLSPDATFPDHLVDVKRAIAWVRENIDRWGGDSSFIAVTGGSAGGHLAGAGGADTKRPGLSAWLRGRRHVGASLCPAVRDSRSARPQPCSLSVALHRVDRHEGLAHRGRRSLGQGVTAHPGRPEAPPFFVLHGSHDFLVPPAESRQFVAALRAVSSQPVWYAELPGATHGFDVMHSLRSRHVVHGIGKYLGGVHLGQKSRQSGSRSVEK